MTDSVNTVNENHSQRKWPTSFWRQYYVLTGRGLKRSKHWLINQFRIVDCVITGTLAGIIFFQLPRTEEYLRSMEGVVGDRCWVFLGFTIGLTKVM